jgi:hypothetical protein
MDRSVEVGSRNLTLRPVGRAGDTGLAGCHAPQGKVFSVWQIPKSGLLWFGCVG